MYDCDIDCYLIMWWDDHLELSCYTSNLWISLLGNQDRFRVVGSYPSQVWLEHGCKVGEGADAWDRLINDTGMGPGCQPARERKRGHACTTWPLGQGAALGWGIQRGEGKAKVGLREWESRLGPWASVERGEPGWHLRQQAERNREREILFFFFLLFQSLFKSILNHFELWSKPLITVNHMHQHECTKMLLSLMIKFNLTKNFVFPMFSWAPKYTIKPF